MITTTLGSAEPLIGELQVAQKGMKRSHLCSNAFPIQDVFHTVRAYLSFAGVNVTLYHGEK